MNWAILTIWSTPPANRCSSARSTLLDLGAARRFFDLRYFGALTAAQAAAPHLRPGGSITLTTGGALARPRPGWTVAVSVLGAVDALTRALAVELAPIRVNAVCPGVVRSPLWDSMSDNEREELLSDSRVRAADRPSRARYPRSPVVTCPSSPSPMQQAACSPSMAAAPSSDHNEVGWTRQIGSWSASGLQAGIHRLGVRGGGVGLF